MPSPSVPAGSQRGAFSVETALQVLLSALLIGPAVIHAALAGSAGEWPTAAGFHVSLALVEGLLAVTVLLTLSRPLVVAIIAVALGTAVVWALSRTTGLPFGPRPGVPAEGGDAGVISTVLELAGAALAAVWIMAPRVAPVAERLRRPVAEGWFLALLLVAAVVTAVLAYVGVLDSLAGAGTSV